MVAQVEAGPSNHARRQKHRKPIKAPIKSSKKTGRLLEKQKVEQLDKMAMDYEPPESLKSFSDLPISDSTKRGLKKAFFTDMTDIQIKSLPVSLKGKDVLGAARTGSGKTLAFLIPMLEILYRRKWGPQDGLGALIISPTRELAVQIFEVLRSIGGYHSFSAGLVIGGKNLKEERDRLARMNILVATPGRLLQHMDQAVGFDADNLQVLVLDEADRILDMGFYRTLSALLSHLPKTRQTLLFSATQTESVADLARLSLKDPVSVGVKEAAAEGATPKALEQHYIICELDKKLDILWSFIKSHLQSKILVFLSSGKQVRFVFETFRKMHPGVPLLHLHGRQKQSARLDMYTRFTSMSHAVLFATDIAARGLDFPSVDWVLQVDAPEDVETYIHRVGRTARYESAGQGLLFLLPSEEEGMKVALAKKNLDVQKIKIRASKTQSIENVLQKLAFEDPEIKYLGQRAFVSYIRSVYLHKDKSIFKVHKLPAERFAESLGLPGAPKIKFLSREVAKQKKNARHDDGVSEMRGSHDHGVSVNGGSDEEKSGSGSNEDDISDAEEQAKADSEAPKTKASKSAVRTKYDRMFERKNQGILSEHYKKLVDHSEDMADDGDEFITLKRADHDLPESGLPEEENLSKRKAKLGKAKRTVLKYKDLGKKLIFDDEGNAHELYELADAEEFFKDGLETAKEAGKKFAEGEKGKMKEADVIDKQLAKEKKREKKRKRKEREKGIYDSDDDGGDTRPGAVLAPAEDDDGYVSPDFDLPSEDDEATPPPSKRPKHLDNAPKPWRPHMTTLEDEEELALRLLRKA